MKELLAGSGMALVIFLAIMGVNITPVIFIGILVGGLYIFFLTQGQINLHNLGKGIEKKSGISFADIGGQDTAINELREALEFIIKPEEIDHMGIRPLKGVLLVGPPGTGKTLLARAAAGLTRSVFICASGSEFIEMYAGVGAKRVRNLFSNARKMAKKESCRSAIIFIDELEILGAKRGKHSSHMEYDQTLNQLLVEMDGITQDEDPRILLIGATNRADILDPALVRPGRFDRQVQVNLPDKDGRRRILDIHTRNKPLKNRDDLDNVSRATFGFSGAHLESLANEAAILAMREGLPFIEERHFVEAIDKVIMGEKLNRKPSRAEIERVSVHESGHAVVSEIVNPGSVSSLTIVPRGKALGFMRKSPQNDQYLFTREELENQIMVTLAGAIAEEMKFGNRSTGAKNDFAQAWDTAQEIVASGLSSLGVVNVSDIPGEVLYEECRKIIGQMEEKTRRVLKEYQHILYLVATHILDEESIDRKRFEDLLQAG